MPLVNAMSSDLRTLLSSRKILMSVAVGKETAIQISNYNFPFGARAGLDGLFWALGDVNQLGRFFCVRMALKRNVQVPSSKKFVDREQWTET